MTGHLTTIFREHELRRHDDVGAHLIAIYRIEDTNLIQKIGRWGKLEIQSLDRKVDQLQIMPSFLRSGSAMLMYTKKKAVLI